MERWTTVAVGALVIVAIGGFAWRAGNPGPGRPATETAVADGGTASSESGDAGSGTLTEVPSPTVPVVPVGVEDAGAMLGNAFSVGDAALNAQLPTGIPKAVRFGVVLVRYRGAEGSTASTRSKDEALRIARTLAEEAKTDFRAAVAKGDSGSMEDAGRMPRGVLEPTTEYTLFLLQPGTVSEPVDTPRGFWILRRIE